MEKPLYLTDCYLREWEAVVVSVGGDDEKQGKFIVLDRTAFYPQGGGQSCDEGTMTRVSDGEAFRVVFTGKFGENISHEVDRPGLQQGETVKCSLDWDRRYKLMRMHTAAHIISAVMNKETGAMITGNQLETEKSRIDFSVDEFDRGKLKSYEEMSNEIAAKGIHVTSEFMPREKVLHDPSMTKLAKGLEHLPPAIKEMRILRIGDTDVQADGGTHVRNTKEVGRIEFVEFINKGKNNRRIYFRLT